VEADLDAGCMRAAVVSVEGHGAEGEDHFAADIRTGILLIFDNHVTNVEPDWQVAFRSGEGPSASVGTSLSPVVMGRQGARVRCNFGLDKQRPLLYPPQGTDGSQELKVCIWDNFIIKLCELFGPVFKPVSSTLCQ
jgi:hypothetical protein